MPRLRERFRTTLLLGFPAALLAAGLFVGSLRSAEWGWRTPLLSEVQELASLEPVRALPRTEAVLATLEAERLLAQQRPYAAWQLLRNIPEMDGPASQAASLVAAAGEFQVERRLVEIVDRFALPLRLHFRSLRQVRRHLLGHSLDVEVERALAGFRFP